MVLRLGGGDLNALVGLIGFFIGILIGIACLKRGFTLKRSYEVSVSEGSVLPTVMAALLILVLTVPALFKASEAGPGSMHARSGSRLSSRSWSARWRRRAAFAWSAVCVTP